MMKLRSAFQLTFALMIHIPWALAKDAGLRGLAVTRELEEWTPCGSPSGPLCNSRQDCVEEQPATEDDLPLFLCVCKPGYTGINCHDHVDECKELDPCSFPFGYCENRSPTDGFYHCGCIDAPGIRPSNVTNEHGVTSCDDLDECSDGTHTCDVNAQCDNTFGSYTCTCHNGFEGDGQSCQEIININANTTTTDDPASDLDTTDEEEVQKVACELKNCNLERSYCAIEADNVTAVCLCLQGFYQIGRGAYCHDELECDDSDVCGKNSICIELQGAYRCQCESGYVANPNEVGCQDADECTNGASINCTSTEVCVNTIGGYDCVAIPSQVPSQVPSLAPSNKPTKRRPAPTIPQTTDFVFQTTDHRENGGRGVISMDINGDGFDDLIVGYTNNKKVYVVLGSPLRLTGTVTEADLDGTKGFVIGASTGLWSNWLGLGAQPAGDMNGDGIDDLIINDPHYDINNNRRGGAVVVMYGSASPFPAFVDISAPDFTTSQKGLFIEGVCTGPLCDFYLFGLDVAGAGDINGDGYADIILNKHGPGFPPTPPSPAEVFSEQAYVIFGGQSPETNISALDGTNGFVVVYDGNATQSHGYPDGIQTVGGCDMNGDNVDDIFVVTLTSAVYTIFGVDHRTGSFNPRIVLADLDGNNGFVFEDIGHVDNIPEIQCLGDWNNDAVADDFIVSFPPDTYVLYGRQNWPKHVNAADIAAGEGFAITPGNFANSQIGVGLASGDLNNDGVPDAIIGAPGYIHRSYDGVVYILYGTNDAPLDLEYGNATYGTLHWNPKPREGCEQEFFGYSVASGDINGDGIADLFAGDPNPYFGSDIFVRLGPFPEFVNSGMPVAPP